MAARKTWSELSTAKRTLIVVTGIVELVLLAVALIDIQRRSADQIVGSKRLWRSFAFISIAGPLAYFVVGRRRTTGDLTGPGR